MPRHSKKLTDLTCKNAPLGIHSDGGGLYLQVRANSKSWIYRYTVGSKQTWMGFGPYPAISLARRLSSQSGTRCQTRRAG